MLQIVPDNLNIDFLARRKYGAMVSATLLVIAFLLIFFLRGIQLGIDFSGGVEAQISFEQPVAIGDVRATLQDAGQDVSVQAFGEEEGMEYLVRAPIIEGVDTVAQAEKIRTALGASLEDAGIVIERTEVVGPQVGKELRVQGLLSILFALIGILAYVWIRFELRYAVGAIAALVHDVILVVGWFSLLGLEFNLPIIAAILTVIGYSLNDTVVVFDRIRENRNRSRRAPIASVINRSINETLSRTFLTSITTLITVICLLLITQVGSVIHNFAAALVAGIVIGTYSSIFIASPTVLLWERRNKK